MENQHIYLMGFMGSGKTTVGRRLAHRLNRDFIDTDELIEEKANQAIPEIFARYGESHFRQQERAVIATVSQLKPSVVALGGGAVCDPVNWRKIQASGITVTLNCQAETILNRLQSDQTRPLLNSAGKDKINQIKELLKKRAPFYLKADFVIDIDGVVSGEKITDRILKLLEVKK